MLHPVQITFRGMEPSEADAAIRQLENYVRKQRGEVKRHGGGEAAS